MMDPRTVLCIVGPTACGKTAVSIRLAEILDGEIVSADAVAVYRGLDVGSAKPTRSERKGIPHHLIDCADIENDSFTVSEFRTLARTSIDDILSRGRLPIVVGGSGLYVDSIFTDMRFSAPSDPDLRMRIEKEYDRDKNAVFDSLRHFDPLTAERLHPNDKKRVVRALEVYYVSGHTFSSLNGSFESAQKNDGTYHAIRIGMTMPRDVLYKRIEARVDRMIVDGLVDEAFALFRKGYTPARYKSMQSIGYAQLYPVFKGECTISDAIDRIKQDTRRFAKRQITWFKRDPDTIWFDVLKSTEKEITDGVIKILK
jgi:tRNA dimethylallyltransferase